MLSAILPAAGQSSRLGQSKIFLELKPGWTVIQESVASIQKLSDLKEVILVSREEDEEKLSKLFPQNVTLVKGGSNRQESVANGLAQSTGDFVLVHDAARPFCSLEMLCSVVKAARDSGAAILAVPAYETLKRTEGSSLSTVSREDIWLAQTPQVFSRDLLLEAHKTEFLATDESQLVERLGHPVTLVQGSRSNLKITSPEDVELARAIYHAR